jgi:hypothetical protein
MSGDRILVAVAIVRTSTLAISRILADSIVLALVQEIDPASAQEADLVLSIGPEPLQGICPESGVAIDQVSVQELVQDL